MRPSTRQILTEGGASAGFASDMELHARISVLEQQVSDQKEATALALAAQKEATAIALAAADKTIVNTVAKVELAAEKTMLVQAIDALEKAFSAQIDHQQELTSQALASADKAVQKAEAAAERRFESVNEFRSTLSDQQRDLATKPEVNLRFKALEDRVNSVVEDARETKGRGVGSSDHRSLIFSLIAAAGTVATLVFLVVTRAPVH